MKTLTIVRHAKSSWADLSQPDFQRALNARGERDAPRVGATLKERFGAVDAMVSSPAKRAITTARILAEALDYPVDRIHQEPEIYEASLDTLLGVVRQYSDAFETLLMVGHNPGFQALATCLTGERFDNLPTCGVVRAQLDVASWSEVKPGCGKLQDFLMPKAL